MAAPPPAADPLEGMEDHRRQAAQPANTRHLRKRGPEMGRCQQEILEGRRLPDPPGIPAQLILAPPRPEDPEPDLAAFQPNGLTNRRMRTRMSGGVRGGGATPPPTRLLTLGPGRDGDPAVGLGWPGFQGPAMTWSWGR